MHTRREMATRAVDRSEEADGHSRHRIAVDVRHGDGQTDRKARAGGGRDPVGGSGRDRRGASGPVSEHEAIGLPPASDAVAWKLPATVFAVSAGAVAMPELFVVTTAWLSPPAKLAPASAAP